MPFAKARIAVPVGLVPTMVQFTRARCSMVPTRMTTCTDKRPPRTSVKGMRHWGLALVCCAMRLCCVLRPPPNVALVAGALPSKVRVADHSYMGAAPWGMAWPCRAAVAVIVGISASAVIVNRVPAGRLVMTRGIRRRCEGYGVYEPPISEEEHALSTAAAQVSKPLILICANS